MEAGVEVRSVGHTEAALLPLSGLQHVISCNSVRYSSCTTIWDVRPSTEISSWVATTNSPNSSPQGRQATPDPSNGSCIHEEPDACFPISDCNPTVVHLEKNCCAPSMLGKQLSSAKAPDNPLYGKFEEVAKALVTPRKPKSKPRPRVVYQAGTK